MDPDQELRALKRGLRALQLLNSRGPMGIAAMGKALSVPRTTAERLLMTLKAEGYLSREPTTRAFALSPKVCGLTAGFSEANWIVHAATPLLFALTTRIGWPLAIATPVGERMTLRVTTDAATSLSLNRRTPGSEIAMMKAGSGFAFIAFLPEYERDMLLALLRASQDPEQQLAKDQRRVKALITEARRLGCAFSPEPDEEDSISVPIFIAERVRAVLLMIFIRSAITRTALLKQYAPRLRALADEISRLAANGRRKTPGSAPAILHIAENRTVRPRL